MINKYIPHVHVVPEDDADNQIATGFFLHPRIREGQVNWRTPPGGWPKVLDVFKEEYIKKLRRWETAHVVLLIDFDGQFAQRIQSFQSQIPPDVKDRVFVVGPLHDPEKLKKSLGIPFEKIGETLADECNRSVSALWNDPQLAHNVGERSRMDAALKPFLFA